MAGGLGSAATVRADTADDEQNLVLRVKRGDKHAFDELARRYACRAFAVAYRILRHTQDAEDLVQESFIATLDGIRSFDPTRPFAPWFYKIIVNRALNAASARATRERHTNAILCSTNEAVEFDLDPAEKSEIRTHFATALAALPRHQRLIVELSDVDGRSSSEIGDMMNLPRGTVRWHLHQARRTLRTALAPLLEHAR